MRRPTTIVGMLLHLARHRVARAPRVALLGVATALAGLGSLAVGSVARVPDAQPPAVDAQTHVHVEPFGGRCQASGVFCVSDLVCGRGDHCVDPHGLAARLATMRGPGSLEDAIPITPSLAWNGEGWSVAWSALEEEQADLYFARTDAAGRRIGQPVRVTRSASLKVLPSLAASPGGYALTWTEIGDDGVTAWVQRLDRNGASRGTPVRLSSQQGLGLASRAVWNGHDYAFAWYNASSATDLAIRFARINEAGEAVGDARNLAERVMPMGLFDLRSMGDGYGAAWSDQGSRGGQGQTVFVRVGAGGEASQPTRVAPGSNGTVALTWAGRHFGAVWEDALSLDDEEAPRSRLAFAGVAPGQIAVPRRELTPRDAYVTQASIAWSGAQYGLAWARIGDDGADVFFNRLDAQGAPGRTPVRLTQGAIGIFPSMAWSGSEFAVVWTHIGARGIQLRLGRINADGRRVGDDVTLADVAMR